MTHAIFADAACPATARLTYFLGIVSEESRYAKHYMTCEHKTLYDVFSTCAASEVALLLANVKRPLFGVMVSSKH